MQEVTTSDVNKTILENAKKISELEKEIALLQQTIGAHKETIKVQEQKMKDMREDFSDRSKQVVIRKIRDGGLRFDEFGQLMPKEQKEYRNLDSIVKDIRKEEKSKLKKDVGALEDKLEDQKLEIEKLSNKLERERAQAEEKLTEEKSKLRERKDKEIQASLERITELKNEIIKIKNNKTDKELEEKRKKEIADLNERIVELEEEIEHLKSIGLFKRMWYKITDFKAKREAYRKELQKSNRISEILDDNASQRPKVYCGTEYAYEPW